MCRVLTASEIGEHFALKNIEARELEQELNKQNGEQTAEEMEAILTRQFERYNAQLEQKGEPE